MGGGIAAVRSSRHCAKFAMGDSFLLWGPSGEPELRLERGKGESGFARVKKCNTKAKGLAGQWMARMRGKDQVCIGHYPSPKDAAYRCAAYTTESPAEEMEAVSSLEAAIAGNNIPEIQAAFDLAPYDVQVWQAVALSRHGFSLFLFFLPFFFFFFFFFLFFCFVFFFFSSFSLFSLFLLFLFFSFSFCSFFFSFSSFLSLSLFSSFLLFLYGRVERS